MLVTSRESRASRNCWETSRNIGFESAVPFGAKDHGNRRRIFHWQLKPVFMATLDAARRAKPIHNYIVTLAIALVIAARDGAAIRAKLNRVRSFLASIPARICGAVVIAPLPIAVVAAKRNQLDKLAARILNMMVMHYRDSSIA
jgi:hypothetical protein